MMLPSLRVAVLYVGMNNNLVLRGWAVAPVHPPANLRHNSGESYRPQKQTAPLQKLIVLAW